MERDFECARAAAGAPGVRDAARCDTGARATRERAVRGARRSRVASLERLARARGRACAF